MAKMVTRTFSTTEVSVLGLDLLTGEGDNRSFVLIGEYADEEKALKQVKKQNVDKTYVPGAVVDMKVKYEVRGMLEAEFLSHSVIVERPNSQRKAEEA